MCFLFQAAEPVAPHEAQPMAAGPDAGGLPWAMFPAGKYSQIPSLQHFLYDSFVY